MLNNYVEVLGDVIFSNYSHAPLGILTDTDTIAIVESGATIAHTEGEAYVYESELAELYTENSSSNTAGAFAGSGSSEAQIVASFAVEATETFSFDFLEDLVIETSEIDNPNAAYSEAQINIGLWLLDTSDLNNLEVLDYADIWANLISSEQVGDIEIDFSDNFIINNDYSYIDLDGNNAIDSIYSTIDGTYQRTFAEDTELTLFAVNQSNIELLGDPLIDNLGANFVYGTLWKDTWQGTRQNDKYYASLGDDLVFGGDGNDVLMAGNGNDRIYAGNGDDELFGGGGDDYLSGSNGNDLIKGGAGDDNLKGSNGDDLLFGGAGNDDLSGSNGNDLIQGDAGDDNLSGSNGDDLLFGGSGNDSLSGGFGSDRFSYATNATFNTNLIGIDAIADFEVNEDLIVLNSKTFTVLTDIDDESLAADEFAVVTNDELVAISEAAIVYSSGTGNLFYNQNGSDLGLGDGGQFATLQNLPELSVTDLAIAV